MVHTEADVTPLEAVGLAPMIPTDLVWINQVIGRTAEQTTLLTFASDATVPALALYGPLAIGKSTLLRATLGALAETANMLPIYCSLAEHADDSRTEFISTLAATIIAKTGLPQTLLDELVPGNFHTTFLANVLSQLAPEQRLLLLFDDIDLADRSRLSKVNNLLLPLLRRLASLSQLKFILAVDDVAPLKIETLLRPLFSNLQLLEVGLLAWPDARQLMQAGDKDSALDWSHGETEETLWRLTAGHPHWITRFHTAVAALSVATPNAATMNFGAAEAPVLPEIIQQALPRVVIAVRPSLLWLWRTLSAEAQSYALAIAASERAVVTPAMLGVSPHGASREQWDTAVAELTQRNLVETTAAGVRFKAELTRHWLINEFSPLPHLLPSPQTPAHVPDRQESTLRSGLRFWLVLIWLLIIAVLLVDLLYLLALFNTNP
jgi:hypothetical protein